ncbi:unnamed protein product [Calypogeia fissa]
MDSQQELPKTHRALVLTSRSEPAKVENIPTLQPTPGSAVVRIIVAGVMSYACEQETDGRGLERFHLCGTRKGAARDCHILNEKLLLGSVDEGGLGYSVKTLAIIGWLLVPYDGLRDVNLKAGETVIITPATRPFGGCAMLVALAMGARVIAMGRNVEALKQLAAINPRRVKTVLITGNVEAETNALRSCFGAVDVFFDISPP